MAAKSEDHISGTQKAAILLIALGPEKSATIFKHLKEEEIEDVLRYLNKTEFQKKIVIRRNSVVPEWAQGDN